MNAIEAIKKGFQVAKNSISLIIIMFVFNFITSAIMLGIIGVNPTPEKMTEITGIIILIFLATMLLWLFLEGGIFSSICSRIKTNQLSLESFTSNCSKFFARLLGINLISGAILMAIWLVGAFLTDHSIIASHPA